MARRHQTLGIGIFAAAALAAGCAHSNGSESATAVRVVNDTQAVAGCERVTEVRLSGAWTKGAAVGELENLARSKGGNVLLLSAGSGTPTSGIAYRCTGGAGGGSH